MIADPVFNHHESNVTREHFKLTDDPLFWIEKDSIGLAKKVGEAFWYINKEDPESWYIPGFFIGKPRSEENEKVSLETFVDHLAKHWPDHLEWFLWHPEWFPL